MKNFLPKSIKSFRGFTLIELLVALTIITILAVAVYAALNPAQRLSDAKNARRTADASEILTAIHQSVVDNKGTLPTKIAAMTNDTEQQIGTSTSAVTCPATVGAIALTQCTGLVTTCIDLMTPTGAPQNLTPYLASTPFDPIGGTTADLTHTGYSVRKAATGIITIKACHADGTTPITVSR